MIERNDQGKDIEVTSPLHSREWCEAVWPGLRYDIYIRSTPHVNEGRVREIAEKLIKRRIDPNSKQYEGIMSGCSDEFKEAVKEKMVNG